MEIQLGFRLNSTQELELLTQALKLVEDKGFKSYITISNNLPVLAEQEATLRRRIEELEKALLPMLELEKLHESVEKLKKEEAELKRRVDILRQSLAKYEEAVKSLQALQD
jgi:predicted RNase H-like nuclease (RuvC/YqgF family)